MLATNRAFCAAIFVTQRKPSCQVVIVAGFIVGFGDAVAVRLCGLSLGSLAFCCGAAVGCGVDVALRSYKAAADAGGATLKPTSASCDGPAANGVVYCESVARIDCKSGTSVPSMSRS